MFLSITGVTEDNRIAKYLRFTSQEEAEAHALEYNGFAARTPIGSMEFWVVDEVAKTVVADIAAALEKSDYEDSMKYIDDRKKAYGTLEQQIENIIEKGLVFEKARVTDIKIQYPKPE